MARTPGTRTAPVPPPEPPGVLPVPEPGAEDRTRPAPWPAAATPPRRDVINRAIAPLPAQRRAARHEPRAPTRPTGTSMWQRCSSQPDAANIVVAPMFAGEQRCHIDVTAEAPRRTSMRQRCSRAAPAPGTHLSRLDL